MVNNHAPPDLFGSSRYKILDLRWRGRNSKQGYTSTATARGILPLLSESSRFFAISAPDDCMPGDNVFVSLSSPSDVVELIEAFENREHGNMPQIHIGGSGCVNIRSVMPLISAASWGRCEGVFNDIVEGETLDNTWRMNSDKRLSGRYLMRQTHHLLSGEESVGRKYKCKFCQYSHTRKLVGKSYSHGDDLSTPEDNMLDMQINASGRHTTSIDGMSEASRFKVSKPISDDFFYDFVSSAIKNDFEKTTSIKIFSIVGYPWETPDSIISDIRNMSKMLFDVGSSTRGGRVFIQMLITPFSPEPLTPMASDQANTDIYWRDIIYDSVGANLCNLSNLNAYILPQINSPLTLLKRISVNRGVAMPVISKLEKLRKPQWEKWTTFMADVKKSMPLDISAEIDQCPVSDYLAVGR